MSLEPMAPKCWSVAGFDPSAYAGLLTDVRVMEACGTQSQAISTCQTVQNRSKAVAVEPANSDQMRAQIECLLEEAKPAAIKIGLLPNQALMKTLGQLLGDLTCTKVLDPVYASSSGLNFGSQDWAVSLREFMLPHVDLVTPNLHELEILLGRQVQRLEELPEAASDLKKLGAKAVLLKGGHLPGIDQQTDVFDYYEDQSCHFWIRTPRIAGEFRGTGCFLSAAVASYASLGLPLSEAVVKAKILLQSSLQWHRANAPSSLGPERLTIAPRLTEMVRVHQHLDTLKQNFSRSPATKYARMGLYPVVDRAAWLERLLPQGVRTIQLRVKDLRGSDLKSEIKQAIVIANRWQADLYINDYWQLAIELGASGVHLGQEDLALASVETIKAAGLRLGISTHNFEELGHAYHLNPSYIALGPVFPTTCKSMRFGPQGFKRLAEWQALCRVPLVAIGGLQPDHIEELKRVDVSGVALISDILQHPNPEERSQQWLRRLGR